MTVRLDGKVALISGVSDGIGGAIARCFASGRTAIQTAVSDFGDFDVLVNNAGLLLLASAALYLASDESRWVTGAELTVDGGYSIRP